jgi:hypothetical protein
MAAATHVMDRYPKRFGWPYWYLEDAGTRLLSPIHSGNMRFWAAVRRGGLPVRAIGFEAFRAGSGLRARRVLLPQHRRH